MPEGKMMSMPVASSAFDIQAARKMYRGKPPLTVGEIMADVQSAIRCGYSSSDIQGSYTPDLIHEVRALGFTVEELADGLRLSGWADDSK